MREDFEEETHSKSSSIAWIALITAVSVTATAIVVAKRIRAASVPRQVGDLVNLCDRAAQALEDRICGSDYAMA
ncbi:MAG TPA: hypothetical protein VGL56_03295 [Fimbriimonadaceae bacterium]|jgi:hypothetical protein